MKTWVLVFAAMMGGTAFAEGGLPKASRSPSGELGMIGFPQPPGEPVMAWEIVKRGKLVYLNDSRFPWGQDPRAWGLGEAWVCFEKVDGKNYVGIGDSLGHLKLAMKFAIEDAHGRSACLFCGTYKEAKDRVPDGLLLPELETKDDLPACPGETPISALALGEARVVC